MNILLFNHILELARDLKDGLVTWNEFEEQLKGILEKASK